MTSKAILLGKLPAFTNKSILIEKNQGVHDIIKEVLEAHNVFSPDYDRIARDFDKGSLIETCKYLFDFCKANIRYKIESETKQTTKSPAAVLALGDSIGGDCKHYAGFIAGVLDALRRQGKKIDWCYRFASYNMFDKTPGHVFVIVRDKGKEIWVDPVLNKFDDRGTLPYHTPIDKRPKSNDTMLYRLSGMNEAAALYPGQLAPEIPMLETATVSDDPALSADIENALRVLLYYGVMNVEGKVNDQLLKDLSTKLDQKEFDKLANARLVIQEAISNPNALAGIFDTIWRGVKKVTLAPARNAYLGLVAINAFGYATKLHNAIYQTGGGNGTGYYQPGQQKLYDKWNSLGGDWHNLRIAIDSGAKKKAILGNTVGAAVAIPAWVAAASAIIAAITPLVLAILKGKSQEGALEPSIDPSTGLPYGIPGDYPGQYGGGSLLDDPLGWIKAHPLETAAIALGGYFIFIKKGRL